MYSWHKTIHVHHCLHNQQYKPFVDQETYQHVRQKGFIAEIQASLLIYLLNTSTVSLYHYARYELLYMINSRPYVGL